MSLKHLALVIFFSVSCNFLVLPSELGDQDWWKHAVFYQIYPRSFKDSDGDGIGDLEGITSKMDHLVDAGITAAWLSPIYKSPQLDLGYDISDYRDVDPMFGTLKELDRLIEEAHQRGVRIIMDFVPNHTSNEHEWFVKSENEEEGYEDFYIWKDPSENGSYPNNWISSFYGPAWEWSEKRQQYYYHRFAIGQPDLNYRNPKVVQEMKDVLTYWLDRGVDGFRIDAVNNLFEDERFLDEPVSGNEDATPDSPEYLQNIYTVDQPETFDMIHQWRDLVDSYVENNGGDARIIMTEAYTDIKTTMLYYGDADGEKLGAHFTFNFFLITNLTAQSTAYDFAEVVNSWLDNLPEIYVPNWVTGNHDRHRQATRFGPENVDLLNMLVLLLPGVGVTYMADEIGQEDGEVSFEQCADPPVCGNEVAFYAIGRDFERTPFQWDDTKNAGFSDANETWLPVSDKYLETNLASQIDAGEKTHYNVYKQLLQLRQKPTFQLLERPTVVALNDDVLAFLVESDETYVVVLNIGDEVREVDLKEAFGTSYLVIEVTSVNSQLEIGSISQSWLNIDPHEGFAARCLFG